MAHSECKPSSFMSSLTHCSHIFLLCPDPSPPPPPTLLQADTQSSTLLRSRCPNHLNLPRLTTSATQLIPRRLLLDSWCRAIMSTVISNYILPTKEELQARKCIKGCINPLCAFCPSRSPHTSISPSYVLSFPNFSDHQPSLPRFQFHISKHSGHKHYRSFSSVTFFQNFS